MTGAIESTSQFGQTLLRTEPVRLAPVKGVDVLLRAFRARAADDMTTLHVREDDLREAIAQAEESGLAGAPKDAITCSFGDFNNDGRLDLVTANFSSGA